ncbi:MAG: DUF2934 domain-containing protein [Chloroflexi bacterium]|nr:MAG: DUF2934 domain-containing protein [Chloroflexota bacterium]
MNTAIEERIRTRAYEIWEAEGRPLGREVEHWLQAAQELAHAARRRRDPGEADPGEADPGDGDRDSHPQPRTEGGGAAVLTAEPVSRGRGREPARRR